MMRVGVDYIGVSAGAMIFNDKVEILLAKRGPLAKNERGTWETPGGAVKFNETLEAAVRREIKEEYGIGIEIIEQLPAADHIIRGEKQHWVATTFLAKIRPDQKPKILEPGKCSDIGWFSLNRLPKPLSLITQQDLKKYREQEGKQLVNRIRWRQNIIR